jgi:transcriptional regulator with XRE-family HTH domain
VGGLLRAIRESHNVGLRQLAEAAGMDAGYLSRLENGRGEHLLLTPVVRQLEAGWDALGVPDGAWETRFLAGMAVLLMTDARARKLTDADLRREAILGLMDGTLKLEECYVAASEV